MLAFKVEQMASGRNALILQNHGLLAWGKSIRDAYWRTEIVEAHCMKSHLVECRNAAPRNFTAEECRELEALRSVFLNGRDK